MNTKQQIAELEQAERELAAKRNELLKAAEEESKAIREMIGEALAQIEPTERPFTVLVRFEEDGTISVSNGFTPASRPSGMVRRTSDDASNFASTKFVALPNGTRFKGEYKGKPVGCVKIGEKQVRLDDGREMSVNASVPAITGLKTANGHAFWLARMVG